VKLPWRNTQLASLVQKNMATIKQIDANRRNAQKSTGPKTPEGKSAVSMNALRHGLRARSVVLPGENRDEFHQLCDDLEAEWQPQSRTEHFYLEQMAVSQWKLTRMEVGESLVRNRFTYVEEQLPLLDRLWQAQCRMERSYARAQRELERLQDPRSQQVHDDTPTAGAADVLPSADADAKVRQSHPPVELATAPEAPTPASSPCVEPDPRTSGQPHPAPSPNPTTPADWADCPKNPGRDTVVTG
jgi:hypothetical protein